MNRPAEGLAVGARPTVELGDPAAVVRVALGCEPGEVARDVILTPFLPLKAFARHVDGGTRRDLAPPFFYSGFTAEFRGHPVTVLLTGVGPSRVGDCAALLSLTPARRLLFAGAVGGLREDLAVGDLFLPAGAGDGEGFSRYLRRPFREIAAGAEAVACPGGLRGRLGDFLRARGVPTREGRVFTIGAFAAESAENLETLAELGYDALEMELSAFYSAAAHHAFEAAALAYVSDL
ncbi:MAG: hypothetical protein HGA98_03635, partial [Deltaproteobacteria bacterium]|nr:hypothetical protein [Deltaproteobacteria bacterium]